MLKEKLEEVLNTLTCREREIIKLRCGPGDGYTYTLEEVGTIFEVTRERVRQIEAKAIRKLQHPIRSCMWRDSLSPSATFRARGIWAAPGQTIGWRGGVKRGHGVAHAERNISTVTTVTGFFTE
jgi:hypothetical protein